MATLPKIGDPIPGSNLKYEAADIANLGGSVNPYGTYTDTQGNPLNLQGTLGQQNLAANKIPGAIWKPAVVTSAAPAVKTTQNTADLATAITPKVTTTMTDAEKAAADTAAKKAETDRIAAESKTAIDTALGKEVGATTPTPPVKTQAEIDAEAGIAETQAQLDTLSKTMDARSASIIAGITAEYDNIIKQQEVQNKAYEGGVTSEGMVSGRGRYAPVMQAGIINAAISEGLGRISTLQAKKQSLILEAENARDEKNFKLLNEKMNEYRDTIKEERSLAVETRKAALEASKEARAQAKEERDADESAFKTSLTQMDRLAPSITSAIEGMDEKEAADYILAISKDYGFDPNLFLGTINKLGQAQQEKMTTAITSLAKDYPSAGIDPETDTFTSASEKVRNSKEYKLDIQKAELDISNTRSIVSSRAADEKVDYSDPILTTYANITGSIVSSPSQARAIMGYVDSIGMDKEVLPNDFTGPLADNQIRESEYQQLINDAFSQFKKSPSSNEREIDINQWLGTDEAMKMLDEEKKKIIYQLGGTPEDFGIW